MNLRERFLVQWVKLKGLPVYGAAIYIDTEFYALVFNTPDLSDHYRLYSDKVPNFPDISKMNLEERANAMVVFYEDKDDWADFFKHVAQLSKDIRERLALEKIVIASDNGADMLVKECGLKMVFDACVPWILESERAAAPATTVAAPASKPPTIFAPPVIALASNPPQHFDSGAHLAEMPVAQQQVQEEVKDLLDGTEHVDASDIVEEEGDVLDEAALRG